METTELRLAYLTNSHSSALCELYRKVFKKDVDPSYFTYKYGLNFDKKNQCSTVALKEDEVVGFFGCMNQDFMDHERRITVKLISVCDFLLLEPYRGRKVFDMLYEHSRKRAEDEQCACMFGFQSEQTFKFCRRMGWEEGRPFDRFVIPINDGKLPKIRAKLRGNDKMFERVAAALKPYVIEVDLDQYNRISDCFSHVYNNSFFTEKSDQDLRFLVRIAKSVMWLKYKHDLVAGIIRFSDDFDMYQFREEILRILKPTGISTLTFHFQRQTREHQFFSNYFEPLKSFKISYIRTYEDGCHIDELALNYMDLDIF